MGRDNLGSDDTVNQLEGCEFIPSNDRNPYMYRFKIVFWSWNTNVYLL